MLKSLSICFAAYGVLSMMQTVGATDKDFIFDVSVALNENDEDIVFPFERDIAKLEAGLKGTTRKKFDDLSEQVETDRDDNDEGEQDDEAYYKMEKKFYDDDGFDQKAFEAARAKDEAEAQVMFGKPEEPEDDDNDGDDDGDGDDDDDDDNSGAEGVDMMKEDAADEKESDDDFEDSRKKQRKLSAPSPRKNLNHLAKLRERHLAGKELSTSERRLLGAHLHARQNDGENLDENERRLIFWWLWAHHKRKRNKRKKPTPRPTRPLKPVPPGTPTGCSLASKCQRRKKVPTRCEVDLLIEMLEFAVTWKKELVSQWLRLSFHDAATFNQETHKGGVNGCLMNNKEFQRQEENLFLGLPILSLATVKKDFLAHPFTCVHISSADIIQFAGHFVATRAVGRPGMTTSKKQQLYRFKWGRPDAKRCDKSLTENIPGFENGAPSRNIPARCLAAGKEIKEKMIDGHGFTAREAAVLIGAHTIGSTRFSFTGLLAGPWVLNGKDNATPKGPVFDNEYFKFLAHRIRPRTVSEFVARRLSPFNTIFLDWFKDGNFWDNLFGKDLNYLDTDVVMAFPTQNEDVHPDFYEHTVEFAQNNKLFVDEFFAALDKMSKLGIKDQSILNAPEQCPISCAGNQMSRYISTHAYLKHLSAAAQTAARNLPSILGSLAARIIRQTRAIFRR